MINHLQRNTTLSVTEPLTLHQFQQVLNRLSNSNFDPDTAVQLYEQSQKIKNPPDLASFAEVYEDAHSRIRTLIEEEQKELGLIDVRNEFLGKETFPFEASLSNLAIRIFKARGFENENPLFELRTEFAEPLAVNLINFETNQTFFSLTPHDKTLKIEIFDVGDFSIGEFSINISQLRNEGLLSNTLEFQNHRKNVEISYDCVHFSSRQEYVSFFRKINEDRTDTAKENISNLLGIKNLLDELMRPPQSGQTKRSLLENTIIASSSGTHTLKDPHVEALMKVKWNPLVNYLQILCLTIIIVNIIVSLLRPGFAGFIPALIFLTWFQLHDEFDTSINPLYLCLLMFIATGIDAVWLLESGILFWRRSALTDEKLYLGSLFPRVVGLISCLLPTLELVAAGMFAMLRRTGYYATKRKLLKPGERKISGFKI